MTGEASHEKYRRLAAECLSLSKQVQDPGHAAELVRMAQAWNELAERAAAAEPDQKK